MLLYDVPDDHLAALTKITDQSIKLDNIEGNLAPILNNIQCKDLFILNMEIEKKYFDEVTMKTKTCNVHLTNLKGDLLPAFKALNVQKLVLKDISINTPVTKQLLKMLNCNVKELEMNSGVSFNPSILFNYSGEGACKSMIFRGNTKSEYYEEADSWFSEIGWSHESGSNYSKFERLESFHRSNQFHFAVY